MNIVSMLAISAKSLELIPSVDRTDYTNSPLTRNLKISTFKHGAVISSFFLPSSKGVYKVSVYLYCNVLCKIPVARTEFV